MITIDKDIYMYDEFPKRGEIKYLIKLPKLKDMIFISKEQLKILNRQFKI